MSIMMKKEVLRGVEGIVQGHRHTDLTMGLPYSRAHALNHHAIPCPTLDHMVFHTGLCQRPLVEKYRMLKLDIMCMETGVIQRLIPSVNSWTSVLVVANLTSSQIQVGTEPKGLLDEFPRARKNVSHTSSAYPFFFGHQKKEYSYRLP